MKRVVVLMVLLVVSVVTLAALLGTKNHDIEEAGAQGERLVAQLQQIESEILRQSLLSQGLEQFSYDSLVFLSRELREQSTFLVSEKSPLRPLKDSNLDRLARDYQLIVLLKLASIERFKTHSAATMAATKNLSWVMEETYAELTEPGDLKADKERLLTATWRFAGTPAKKDAEEGLIARLELLEKESTWEGAASSVATLKWMVKNTQKHAVARDIALGELLSPEGLLTLDRLLQRCYYLEAERAQKEISGEFIALANVLVIGLLFLTLLRYLAVYLQKRSIYRKSLEESISAHRVSLNRLRAEIKDVRKSAELAHHTKTRFLRNMGHELRTPLNGILGMTDLALMASPEEPVSSYLKEARGSAKSLLSLINHLLELATEDRVQLLNIQSFTFPALLKKPLFEWVKKGSDKGVQVSLEVSEKLEGALMGDHRRLLQMFDHIMDNALKFTEPNGTILLRLNPSPEKDGQRMVSIQIEDTGIGIPEVRLNKIFELFEQGDNSSTRRHGGLGLGLALTKKLVHEMGGELWLDSIEDAGTRVFISLPFDPPKETTAASVAGKASPVAPANVAPWEVASISSDKTTPISAENGTIGLGL